MKFEWKFLNEFIIQLITQKKKCCTLLSKYAVSAYPAARFRKHKTYMPGSQNTHAFEKKIERESVIAIESDYFFMRHRGVLKYKHYNSQGLLQIRIFFQNSPN